MGHHENIIYLSLSLLLSPTQKSLNQRFDVMVNGGGAITLQFQRSPFRPMTRTVFVPWNQVKNIYALFISYLPWIIRCAPRKMHAFGIKISKKFAS